MEDDGGNQTTRPHRKRQAGSKVDKKKRKQLDDLDQSKCQRNPKAFAFQSINKVARQVRRSLDVQERKHHIPVIDRIPAEPPPALVAVVGPPKVGKTTLVRCLVRNFTRQKVTDIKGPITVVASKKKRLTIMECNNDINSMIDIAKVADLVLLMIDASFDYEMETLEFINICHVHGFPKIIGILTHLDMFRDKKKLRKKKKSLKDRFWKEVYQGAKLFYLSGMINGEYQKTEIHNLGRFISVMKYRPLHWHSTHPYLLVDRVEDVTDPNTLRTVPKSDRSVCLYGYVRGCHYRNHSHIHIPGCGDFTIADMSLLQDPCALPDRIKKRSLNEKERLIYGPMSGVGGIVYDIDAIYLELGGSHVLRDKQLVKDHLLTKMVDQMLDSKRTIDEKMADCEFTMFSNSASSHVKSMSEADNIEPTAECKDDQDEEENNFEQDNYKSDICNFGHSKTVSDVQEIINGKPVIKRRRLAQDEVKYEDDNCDYHDYDDDHIYNGDHGDDVDVSDSAHFIDEVEVEGKVRWKNNLFSKASEAFFRRQKTHFSLADHVYNDNNTDSWGLRGHTVGNVFHYEETSSIKSSGINDVDFSKFTLPTGLTDVTSICETLEWDVDKILQSLKDIFVTGKWSDGDDAKTLLDDGGGDDLEMLHFPQKKQPDQTAETTAERRHRRMKEKLERAKLRKKALFDSEYDDCGTDNAGTKSFYEAWKAELEEQVKLNRAEFGELDDAVRVKFEGFRPGLYVRIQINNMPAEFIDNMDPTYPIILGGLLSAEQNIGYVTVKVKQHRWYKRKLKTNDPLIVSLGWRRFQTIVVYSMLDHNGRHRYLKYTPDHLHCHATFWGPLTPQTTGVLAVQTTSSNVPEFRIAITGSVVELDKSMIVMKKLKLQGTPYKIYKNTAFIQGMFTTALEVAKFEGSLIQTVSKIRGQVKKAVHGGTAGSFRATFEDKIQLSDLVFLKAWIPVAIQQLYNPVTSHLLPVRSKDMWQGMKTVGDLKREYGIKSAVSPDHLYHPILRQHRDFNPLIVPKELQKALPFKDKPKVSISTTDKVQGSRIAIIREPRERKVAQLMTMIKALHEQKRRKDREVMRKRAFQHQKKLADIETNKAIKRKERAKHAFFLLGQSDKQLNSENA